MRERVPPYDVVAQELGEPVRLSGPPTRLVGAMPLHNPGEERVVLRRAALVGDLVRGGRHTQRMATVKLEPAAETRFEMLFELDPHTPPGRYQCELDVAGVRRPVEVQVTEVARVRFEPRTIVVQAAPGARVAKQLMVHNVGNVPILVEAHLAVALDDDLLDCRVLRDAVSRFAEREAAGFDELLQDLARAGKRVLDDSGIARVKVRTGAGAVGPGEVRTLDLEITVPETLHHGSRYGGRITIGHRVVGVVIAPQRPGRHLDDEPDEEPGPPSKPEPAARPVAKGSRKRGAVVPPSRGRST